MNRIHTEHSTDHASKQFFVFSGAGKPIYAFRAEEDALAGAMATAKAIISVMQSSGDSLRYMRSGKRVVAFLDRTPLYLVAVSTLGEPAAVLRMQLALVHGQLIALLTERAIKNILDKNPGYDVRRLLSGADVMFDSLISSFTEVPSSVLGAYPCLPVARPTRGIIRDGLRTAATNANASFAFLMASGMVVSGVNSQSMRGCSLQQWDILLLLNFVQSNVGLRQAETFTPLCLPSYDSAGHFHAYINFLDADTSTVLVLLIGSATPDHISCVGASQSFVEYLQEKGEFENLIEAARNRRGSSSDIGIHAIRDMLDHDIRQSWLALAGVIAGGNVDESTMQMAHHVTSEMPRILHFAFKLSRYQQYVESSLDSLSEYCELERKQMQEYIMVAYGQLRASMFDHAREHVVGPLQSLRFEQRESMAFVVILSQETEIYVAFDGMVKKSMSLSLAEHLRKWLESKTDYLFFQTI